MVTVTHTFFPPILQLLPKSFNLSTNHTHYSLSLYGGKAATKRRRLGGEDLTTCINPSSFLGGAGPIRSIISYLFMVARQRQPRQRQGCNPIAHLTHSENGDDVSWWHCKTDATMSHTPTSWCRGKQTSKAAVGQTG